MARSVETRLNTAPESGGAQRTSMKVICYTTFDISRLRSQFDSEIVLRLEFARD